jgi:hypothetical protein
VPRQRLRYCVYIHESADLEAAVSYWASVTAAAPDQFLRPVIKHHTPRTSRQGDNAGYHGCLRVSVTKSSELYRQISGWAWRHDRQAAGSGANVRNPGELDDLREQAVALRRTGMSVRRIKQLLGPIGNRALSDALRGEPPPEWTRRPNAKDDLRANARELRRQGRGYEEIVAQLGVSKSSVSLWVRDLPGPPRVFPEECAKRAAERMRRYWSAERPVRAARRAAVRQDSLKRHNPLTKRKNIGDGYHGCVRVDVKRSCELYRKIEGWAVAIMSGIRPENGQALNPNALPGEDSNLG